MPLEINLLGEAHPLTLLNMGMISSIECNNYRKAALLAAIELAAIIEETKPTVIYQEGIHPDRLPEITEILDSSSAFEAVHIMSPSFLYGLANPQCRTVYLGNAPIKGESIWTAIIADDLTTSDTAIISVGKDHINSGLLEYHLEKLGIRPMRQHIARDVEEYLDFVIKNPGKTRELMNVRYISLLNNLESIAVQRYKIAPK